MATSAQLIAARRKFLTCENCRAQMPASAVVGQGDAGACPRCGIPARVDVFPAFFRQTGPGQAGDPILFDKESSCFYHPEKKAVVPCECCGRFLCVLCDLELDGRHICTACVSAEREKGRLERLENERVLYDTIALEVAGVPLILAPCFWFVWPIVGVLAGAVALFMVFRYWKAPPPLFRRRKWRMVLAAVLGACDITGGIAAAFLLTQFFFSV